MSNSYQVPSKILFVILSLILPSATSWGSVVISSETISASESSGNNILAGTATFNLLASEISDVEMLADFSIVDAGVNIVINGTSLFPQYQDLSQFGPESVFTGTGESDGGGINQPFEANSNNLPRLTVNSTSAGTTFSGATFIGSTSTVTYTPVFTPEDFSSLLQSGSNTIEFIVLNGFEAARLEGNVIVTLPAAAVPEPSSAGLALLAILAGLAARRR